MKWHEDLYMRAVYSSYAVLGLGALGIAVMSPEYTAHLEMGIKLYVAIILLWRFRPGETVTATARSFNRRIAFTGGAFLMLSLLLKSQPPPCEATSSPGLPFAPLMSTMNEHRQALNK